MRDVHKLKEKYELSLDNRQIVSLSIAGVIVLGGVFALGLMVGKKLQSEVQPVAPADLLSALDEKSAALDSMQRDASLTFQDELTRKLKPVAAPAEEPIKKAEPLVEARPVEPKPEAKVEPVKPAESKPAEVVRAPEPRPVEIKPEGPKNEEVPTRIAPTKDAGALREAIARAQRPAEPTAQRPTEASADGTWTLQLSAYQDKGEADRFAAGLRDRGYAPFIVEAQVSGKGTWYRVRMGRFPSRDAAGRYLADFKRETSIDAFVTNAN